MTMKRGYIGWVLNVLRQLPNYDTILIKGVILPLLANNVFVRSHWLRTKNSTFPLLLLNTFHWWKTFNKVLIASNYNQVISFRHILILIRISLLFIFRTFYSQSNYINIETKKTHTLDFLSNHMETFIQCSSQCSITSQNQNICSFYVCCVFSISLNSCNVNKINAS